MIKLTDVINLFVLLSIRVCYHNISDTLIRMVHTEKAYFGSRVCSNLHVYFITTQSLSVKSNWSEVIKQIDYAEHLDLSHSLFPMLVMCNTVQFSNLLDKHSFLCQSADVAFQSAVLWFLIG